jgi:hypothetical protein
MSMTPQEMELAIQLLPAEKQAQIRAMLRGDKEKRTHRGTSRIPPDLQPYNLTYVVTCNLCGTVSEQWFAMQRQHGSSYLVSIPLSVKPAVSTECRRRVRVCPVCQDRLMAWSKEKVVERLVKTVRGETL